MNHQNHCYHGLFLALMTGLVLLPLGPLAAEDRTIDPEVEKVLRERLILLQEAAKLHREAYQSGAASFSKTLSGDQAVLEAELELASSAAERVRIREGILKNAELLEKTVEAMVKSAEGPRMDLLSARANRLRAKADLLLERKVAAR